MAASNVLQVVEVNWPDWYKLAQRYWVQDDQKMIFTIMFGSNAGFRACMTELKEHWQRLAPRGPDGALPQVTSWRIEQLREVPARVNVHFEQKSDQFVQLIMSVNGPGISEFCQLLPLFQSLGTAPSTSPEPGK